MERLFTADWHLCHRGILESCNRPFKDEEEMNYYILDYVMKNVHKTKDELYILGDIGWNNWSWIESVLSVCPYKTFVLFGNHDRKWKKKISEVVHWAGDFKEIRIDRQKISLMHYAMRTWPSSHYGAWQLYAHSHGNLQLESLQYDVGLDNNNYEFISFEDIRKIMEEKIRITKEEGKIMNVTGYWAHESKPWYRTKVHIMVNRKPVCGVNINNKMQFQYCSSSGFYIECTKCTRIYEDKKIKCKNCKEVNDKPRCSHCGKSIL